MRRKNLLFAVLITILSFAGAARAQEVTKTTLPNGLTVLIEEEHSAPVVAMEVWVRVGGADETDAEAGISHVFEHMLFKGTKKRGLGEIATEVESLGGDINAYTSFDNTVYTIVLPSRHFATGLDIIGDAVQNSAFDPGELEKELEVVLEEIRMNEDSPGRTLYKTILSTAYTGHPYKRPVIGFKEVVKGLKREDLLRFLKKWYVPDNMTLVIVGDVKREDALRAVESVFGGFEKGVTKRRPRPAEPPQEGMRIKILPGDIKETHLALAFHIPELKNPDTYPIDLVSGTLGEGLSSRLPKRLKIKKNIVRTIGSYTMSLKEPGLFLITGTLEAEKLEEAITEILAELRKFSEEGPSSEELKTTQLGLESGFIYSRETMEGISEKLGYFETVAGDFRFEEKYLEGIRKVNADDVKRVIKEYLNDKNLSVIVLVPEDKKALVTEPLIEGAVKAAHEKAKEELAREELPGVRKTKLTNGITLLVKEVHANPTVSFYAAFPGGLVFENREKNGVGNFTTRMLTMGTKTRTREALVGEVEGLAGSIGGFSGWNTVGVSGKFLSRDFEKGLEIFSEVLMNPVFPEEEMEKLRQDTLAEIKSIEDSLPSYTFKLLLGALFEAHPYGMPVLGTEETVSRLKREDLVRNHEELFVPERMVIAVVGDIETEEAVRLVEKHLGSFKRTAMALPQRPKEKKRTGVKETGAKKEKEQTHIAIAFPGVTVGSDDRYPLQVLTSILSGQGGRLFIELRDKLSLAYSISAFSREGMDPGYVTLYMASAPDKKEEAIKALLKELGKLREEKVTEEELKRAKNSIIGGYEIGLQEVSAQAADMVTHELLGLGYDFQKKYAEKIEAVTAEDVLEAARKYIDLNAYTISVVGP